MFRLMPFVRRGLFEPLHGWISHSPKLRYWRELEKTQFYPEEKLRKIQWRRLSELLRYVAENNDFYCRRFQSAGISPQDIQSPEDLRRLPLLTKAEIRANGQAMISRGFAVERLQKAKTGGSTGKALELYFTEECSELRNACALRHNLWSGWNRGEPIAAIWGNPVLPNTLKETLRQFISGPPVIYLDTMAVSSASVARFVDEWRQVKPTLIFGHAHSLYLLARKLEEMRISDLCPKGIISSSMMLLPHERAKIEEIFGIKVIDRYGCEEVSLIASECEKHEGMHLNIEHLFVEFLRDDDTPVADGEPGRIVVTDLMNRAMPLIRYQVEDVGVPTNRHCSCGRGLPLMENVTGRVADFLVKKDGSRVAGVSLIENTLTRFPGLDQLQIIQTQLQRFVIRIVPGKGYEGQTVKELEKYFKGVFGEETEVEIEKISDIPKESSGKYRFSICALK
ncbi:MAG: phenylacetate--CoA ligase family protein [Desulfuromonadaceae bacterium]|nr:phenylacetate--CoA ligase family protein [Desulfuromonadaceae bacterium]